VVIAAYASPTRLVDPLSESRADDAWNDCGDDCGGGGDVECETYFYSVHADDWWNECDVAETLSLLQLQVDLLLIPGRYCGLSRQDPSRSAL
jgi:hypothetical protein